MYLEVDECYTTVCRVWPDPRSRSRSRRSKMCRMSINSNGRCSAIVRV